MSTALSALEFDAVKPLELEPDTNSWPTSIGVSLSFE